MLTWGSMPKPFNTNLTGPVHEEGTPNLPAEMEELQWWKLYEQCISNNVSLTEVKSFWPKEEVRRAKIHQLSVVKTFFVKIIDMLKMSSSAPGANHHQVAVAATALSVIIPRLAEDPAFEQGFFWDFSFSDDGNSSCATELLDALLLLLFQPGFTVPESIDSEGTEEQSGTNRTQINRAKSPLDGTTDAMVLRQSELVNLLLVCVSSGLFVPFDSYAETQQLWQLHLTKSRSLFNYLTEIVFGYKVPKPRVGFFRKVYKPQRVDSLARSCLHLWILLMNMGTEKVGNLKPHETLGTDAEINPWWRFLNECDAGVCEWMLENVELNLATSMQYLKKRLVPADFSQEYVFALWILLTMHSKFYLSFGESAETANALLASLLERLIWNPPPRDDAETPSPTGENEKLTEASQRKVLPELGATNMLAFTLLMMSTRRSFAVALNEPLPKNMAQMSGLGKTPMATFADLLIASVYSVLSHEMKICLDGRLSSWCELLIIVISNCSAFVKSFSLESAVMLVHLIDRMSRPSWLPNTRHQINLLLSMFNNILQYQYEGNASLLYVILREHAIFRRLIQASSSPMVPALDSQQTTPSDIPNTDSPTAAVYRFASASLSGRFHTEHIEKVISHLLPKVEAYCQDQGLNNHGQVLEYLAKTTLVGILPVPHKILVRNFLSSKDASTWIISYSWGMIFMKNEFLEWLPYDTENVQMIVFNN
eukprot:Gregarina_sp_Poly_1__7843@NODE_444_length_8342_cov_78_805438_g362_i0_p3_GENE_NODE_444_length_8342_cov_78_805438_g362_i0NODE_444_length_8342_cov_78_805438_g362_i0_p3_ORF_typecomplete_len710_score95_20Hid1/PF12722_7/4_3e21Hid1/PF12722_7/2_7e43Dymeclin/PF09742_9/7e55_NODE_444_length_8342_cov_78_805438_g362_i054707599